MLTYEAAQSASFEELSAMCRDDRLTDYDRARALNQIAWRTSNIRLILETRKEMTRLIKESSK